MCYLDTANSAKHTIGVYENTAFDFDIWWRIRMSSQEFLDELEPKITDLLEEAIREVKEEYLRRLQDTRNVIDQLLGVTAEALETGAVAETGTPMAEVPEPVDVPAPPTTFLPELHAAVASLDRCRTQNEILSSLVESAGSFASRAALFLTREDGLQGWSSQGFAEGDEAFESLVLEYDEGSPWGRLSNGRGVIELDATECADLCSRIDNSSPSSGVLVPIVLRDHLAVALYADQVEDDESVGLSALQLLAYVAAQALETLPIRERSSTATLRLATDAPVGEPVLTLWQFHAPEADVAIVEEIEEVVEPAIEEEAEDLYAAEAVEEVAAQDEAAEAVDFEEAKEIEVTFEEEAAEEEAEVEAVDFEEVEEEIEEAVDVEGAEEVEEALEEEAAAIEAEVEAVDFQEVEEEIEEADEVVEAVDFEEAEEADEAVEAVDFEEAEEIEEAHEEEAEVEIAAESAFLPAEETGFEVEPAAEDEWAAPAEIEEETAEEEFVAPPPEPEVAPEPAPVTVGGAEIAPPEDVTGAGWAFTTNRFNAETGGGEAVHEEARRLARLLVTEIKLYNEEQVEAGRRNRNIYEVLREDIDRSRQIYEERIDDDVRTEADYFHDELVRILAAGESEILGL
ncbi:MAG: hypothetical protein WBO74_04110 [Thermoanaerobaculia bacterium]